MPVTQYQSDSAIATKPRLDYMQSTYGENKYDRSLEMNSSMTIAPNANDEFSQRVASGK